MGSIEKLIKYNPKVAIAFLVVLLAFLISFGLYAKKPKAKKKQAQRPVPIVTAVELNRSTEKVFIEAFGNVIPARKLELVAEVEGRVVEQNLELVPGGIIQRNALVVQLDKKDYLLQVEERKAEVAEAQYRLELEKGQQAIAEREWNLFEKSSSSSTSNTKLALRGPHLEYALTNLEAARSRLEAAEYAVQKTTIRAPFDGLVLEEFVEQGQFLGKQKAIATLAATEQFWVQVSVPVPDLERIHFTNGKQESGSSARIILDSDNSKTVVRLARAFKLLGDLDPKGRMARILVTIDDPLSLTLGKGDEGKNRILLGSYVKVEIDVGSLEEVYTIPREAMRDNEHIWLITTDGRLVLRKTEIRWRRLEDFLVSAEINPGEKLIVSRLQTPLPGMQLRTVVDQ